MDAEEIKNILDAEQTDEEKKKDLITNEIPKLGEHPSDENPLFYFEELL